jgi:carbon-monoxide dehydrogenase large subunit
LRTFPQLIAKQLGVDISKVRLVAGDSAQTPGLVATVASRSVMMAGSALTLACDEAIRRGKLIAAELLEAAAADIEFADGGFRVAGTDLSIPILEMTARLQNVPALPDGVPTELSNLAKFTSPAMTFPNGCHVSEVEVDPATGHTRVLRYAAVDDVGVVLNESVVEGQVTGGVVQGLGQVFGERLVHDASGQLLNASFMDYPMPHAGLLPVPAIGHHVAPCRTNPLGVKGAGESGVTGALPSTVSAILDALAARGVRELDLPFTPGRVWSALQAAGRS